MSTVVQDDHRALIRELEAVLAEHDKDELAFADVVLIQRWGDENI